MSRPPRIRHNWPDDAHHASYERPPGAPYISPRVHFPLTRSPAFVWGLDRPCERHHAEPGTPCWEVPGDRGVHPAMCGGRVTTHV
jgi:hypothetical protein